MRSVVHPGTVVTKIPSQQHWWSQSNHIFSQWELQLYKTSLLWDIYWSSGHAFRKNKTLFSIVLFNQCSIYIKSKSYGHCKLLVSLCFALLYNCSAYCLNPGRKTHPFSCLKRTHQRSSDLHHKWSCIFHRLRITALHWRLSCSRCRSAELWWKAETSGLHEKSLHFYFSQCSSTTWSLAAVPQRHISSHRRPFAWHWTQPASLKLKHCGIQFVSDRRDDKQWVRCNYRLLISAWHQFNIIVYLVPLYVYIADISD